MSSEELVCALRDFVDSGGFLDLAEAFRWADYQTVIVPDSDNPPDVLPPNGCEPIGSWRVAAATAERIAWERPLRRADFKGGRGCPVEPYHVSCGNCGWSGRLQDLERHLREALCPDCQVVLVGDGAEPLGPTAEKG